MPVLHCTDDSIAADAVRVLQRRMSVAPRKRQSATKMLPVVKAQAVWKGVGMRGIVSATPVSRSWSTNLKRTGSLTAQTHPGASARIDLNARYPSA